MYQNRFAHALRSYTLLIVRCAVFCIFIGIEANYSGDPGVQPLPWQRHGNTTNVDDWNTYPVMWPHKKGHGEAPIPRYWGFVVLAFLYSNPVTTCIYMVPW